MAFIPVPNTLQIEVRMIQDQQRIENTIYVERGTAWTEADITTVAGRVRQWWEDSIAPLVSDTVTLSSIYARDLSTATGLMAEIPGAYAGELPSPAMPNSVSLAVSFRTGLVGRSFRGRNYVVGLVEGQVDGNQVNILTRAAYVNAYEELPALFAIEGGEWVVVSRYTNNAPRVTGVTTPVTSTVIVDATVDSMRRRLPGRGQ